MEEERHDEEKKELKNVTKKNRSVYGFVHYVFVFLLLVGAYIAGIQKGTDSDFSQKNSNSPLSLSSGIFSSSKEKTDMSLFWKSWDMLHEKYVDHESIDDTKLLYGAINGMLSASGDPYTTFFNPEETKAFNEEISGSFEGIGAEIGMKNKILTVISPLDGSPSERAGLRAGDKIFKINNENTGELSIDEAVKKMRGKKDTEVKLTIFRDGEMETRDITIIRDTIVLKSVKLEWKDSNIAVVKITQFGEDTTHEFTGVVKELKAKNVKGLILDLRNNPGGLLRSSVDIASFMLPKGVPVVFEEDSKKNREALKTDGGDVLSNVPTIALINEGSASASEILAGALRENRENVILLGKKSFGKGSVQELANVSKDTSLKITVARWLTPKGNQINEKGIAPDIEVEKTNEDYEKNRDPQMDKAIEVVKSKL